MNSQGYLVIPFVGGLLIHLLPVFTHFLFQFTHLMPLMMVFIYAFEGVVHSCPRRVCFPMVEVCADVLHGVFIPDLDGVFTASSTP